MTIQASALKAGYGRQVIIPHLDVQFDPGRLSIIIGSNGCGKSTLLKCLGRIIQPLAGNVHLDGHAAHRIPTASLARRLAYLPQSPTAPEGMTVRELVSHGRYPHKHRFAGLDRADQTIIDRVLRQTDLLECQQAVVRNLSGGQRQRAWIAMILAQETDTILLDEPTTYLDLAHQLELLTLIRDINRQQGTTVVMVMHELNLAAKFADCLVGLKNGQLCFAGPPCQVITPARMHQLMNIKAEIQHDPSKTYPIIHDYGLDSPTIQTDRLP